MIYGFLQLWSSSLSKCPVCFWGLCFLLAVWSSCDSWMIFSGGFSYGCGTSFLFFFLSFQNVVCLLFRIFGRSDKALWRTWVKVIIYILCSSLVVIASGISSGSGVYLAYVFVVLWLVSFVAHSILVCDGMLMFELFCIICDQYQFINDSKNKVRH